MFDKNDFQKYIEVFLEQNSMLNLISKNDEKYIWEKHIFDSLAIEKVFEKYDKGKNLLDIGTGGGFPAVPIALAHPDIEVYALDSIRKKINAIEKLKSELNIKNLHPVCERVENLHEKFDIITSRAVAPLKVIVEYAAPLMHSNSFFAAYKSRKTKEEIQDAQKVLKKYKLAISDIFEYNLPLLEIHSRNIIVIKKDN